MGRRPEGYLTPHGIVKETTAARYYGSTLPESRFPHLERMNTQIVSASPAIIAALSPQETAQSLKTACSQYAVFAEKGCKYIGLLRGQLVRSGESPDEVFAIVKDALVKGGMDEKRAKSTANNGKGHSELAEFALKSEGVALKEPHFYGISVADARRVTSFLRKGGDEAISAVNKIALTAKGGVTSKAIDKLIPPAAPTGGGEGDGEGDGEGEGEGEGGGGSTKSAFDRAVILMTSIQALMKEMTEEEQDALREMSMEFIIG